MSPSSHFPRPIASTPPGKRLPTRRRPITGASGHSLEHFILRYTGVIFLAIAATIQLRTVGILFSIVLLASCMLYHASRGNWHVTFAYYFAYLALEGMFKYGTDFSTIVYMARPAIVLSCILAWGLSGKKLPESPPLLSVYFILAGIGLVQVFHPLGGGPISSLSALIMWYLLPVPFYLLGILSIKKQEDFQLILTACIIVGVIVASIALLQWVMGQPWTESHFHGYANLKKSAWHTRTAEGELVSAWRPAATGAQSGGGSFWAHTGALCAIGLLLTSNIPLHRKALLLAAVFVCYAGMFVSGVRLWIIVGVIETGLLLTLNTSNIRHVLRNVFILLATCLVLTVAYLAANKISGGILNARYSNTFSNPIRKFSEDRGSNFSRIHEVIAQYPLGIGFQRGLSKGEYSVSGVTANRESQITSTLADLGILGLVFHCWFIVGVTHYTYKAARRIQSTATRSLAYTAWIFILGVNVSMFAGPAWQDFGVFFCFFAGAIFKMANLHEASLTRASHAPQLARTPLANRRPPRRTMQLEYASRRMRSNRRFHA